MCHTPFYHDFILAAGKLYRLVEGNLAYPTLAWLRDFVEKVVWCLSRLLYVIREVL